MKKNAWNIRCLVDESFVHRPSEPAYYIEDCRIFAVHGMENVVVVDLTGLSLVPGNAVFQAVGFGLQFQRRTTTAAAASAVKLEPAMLYTVSSLTIFSNVCREKYV